MSFKITVASALFALIAVLVVHQNFPSGDQLWKQWKEREGMLFSSEIEQYRRLIFQQNHNFIQSHNAHSGRSHELQTNSFAHLTTAEFENMFGSKNQKNIPETFIGSAVEFNGPIPNDVDWEKQGKTSPVKNQGQCDAGYAFCSNSLAESYSLMKNTNLLLSEQNIVDCSANYTTFGCSGGSRSGTILYLQEKGVASEAKYPWVGTKQTCKNLTSEFKLTTNIKTTNGCAELQAQLVVSPLTVAVNTTNWQFYKSGILETCGTEVNHDILLVGFSEAAWKLKNSWGVRWGEYGYIRIRSGETCGICSKPGFGFKL